MTLIILFPESATYRTPAVVSTATAAGLLNVADVPTPLNDPLVAFPASVNTVLLDTVMALIKLFPESATYTTPAVESIATEVGKLKLADVPTPLDDPLAVSLPARVDTVLLFTVLIAWLPESATYTTPAAVSRPKGALKLDEARVYTEPIV